MLVAMSVKTSLRAAAGQHWEKQNQPFLEVLNTDPRKDPGQNQVQEHADGRGLLVGELGM